MKKNQCNCAFKKQMIRELLEKRMASPTEDNAWIALLLQDVNDKSAGGETCCILLALCYYGYCKESPFSEPAREVLEPLVGMKK